ncbi:MAG: carbamate kinase [Candidatus Eremiobacteraeota bacterium]|nr:carbamate kinase [Candidatus Eremiobacteraeota bacterium]
MSKVAVVAIGGNSLIKSKDKQTIPDQFTAVRETAEHIADMIGMGYNVVITHGNGPQVGFILRRSELAAHELHTVPLDYCGADTQGAIGYMIQQSLNNILRRRGIERKIVTVVTQVIVSKDDSAFQNPSKPIGSFIESREEAESKAKKYGWHIVEDAGRGYRRVVPSPIPKEIVERDAINCLIKNGFIVVAVGGGGIPVIRDENGDLIGVEAVIDKDYASSLLASSINADLFIISTAVNKVAINFNKPDQVDLDYLSLEDAKKYLAEGHFAKGSMAPKIQAIINFLEKGGEKSIITMPETIIDALNGKNGTLITREPISVR